MSVDEYAALELACGEKLVRAGTRWWRRVRPCFYRPLLPFEEISPSDANPPRACRLGGAQYVVPDGVVANSQMNFILFEKPQSYSLQQLKKNIRYQVRKAEKAFSVRPLTSATELASKGHSVYLSFYDRTEYGYRTDRIQYGKFALWAQTLYAFSNGLVLGAFDKEELVALSISYLVQDVIFYSTFFSKTEALSRYVSDLMLHKIRESAAVLTNVRFIFAGMVGMGPGLDAFYSMRGATMVARPALLAGNAFSLFLLRTFLKQSYQKLLGNGAVECGKPVSAGAGVGSGDFVKADCQAGLSQR